MCTEHLKFQYSNKNVKMSVRVRVRSHHDYTFNFIQKIRPLSLNLYTFILKKTKTIEKKMKLLGHIHKSVTNVDLQLLYTHENNI